MDLSNTRDWLKIFDRSLVADPDPARPGKFLRIPRIQVPAEINKHVIAVYSSCTNSKPSWNAGVLVYPIVPVFDSEFGQLKTRTYHQTTLNETTKINIKKESPTYRIEIAFPKWFNNAQVAIWVFQGQEEADTIGEALNRLTDSLVELRETMARVESKLDNQS